MIGQEELLKTVDELIADGKFPRFSVIQGVDGSGKNLLVQHIKDKINCTMVEMSNSVESVRDAMKEAYSVADTMIFYFRGADSMSQSARNALLKVTEEPPNHAYFILTVVNKDSLPPTIASRAVSIDMQPYTQDELIYYMQSKYEYTDDEEFQKIALEICDNPGEIELLFENGALKLYEFVEKVMNNIAEVSVANAMKIADSIAFKDDEENKFDLGLFWKAVIMYYCTDLQNSANNISVEELRAKAKIVMSTKECIDMITKTRGINKRNVFDIWILDVREILGEEYGSN